MHTNICCITCTCKFQSGIARINGIGDGDGNVLSGDGVEMVVKNMGMGWEWG